jgi:hypothetical protein
MQFPGASSGYPGGDAELVAFGAELESVIRDWIEQRTEDIRDPHNNTDEDGCSTAWPVIHDRMRPLCDHIVACRAQTLAGFAVQARAASFVMHDAFEDDKEHEESRAFIDAACAFAGVATVAAEETRALEAMAVQS